MPATLPADVAKALQYGEAAPSGPSGDEKRAWEQLDFFYKHGAYPDEIYTAPRSWTERAYPKLIHYNKLPKGGHFAAWEQPKSFGEELRASFKTLRS